MNSALKLNTEPLSHLTEWWRKIFRTERRFGARGVLTEIPDSTHEEEVSTKFSATTAFETFWDLGKILRI